MMFLKKFNTYYTKQILLWGMLIVILWSTKTLIGEVHNPIANLGKYSLIQLLDLLITGGYYLLGASIIGRICEYFIDSLYFKDSTSTYSLMTKIGYLIIIFWNYFYEMRVFHFFYWLIISASVFSLGNNLIPIEIRDLADIEDVNNIIELSQYQFDAVAMGFCIMGVGVALLIHTVILLCRSMYNLFFHYHFDKYDDCIKRLKFNVRNKKGMSNESF